MGVSDGGRGTGPRLLIVAAQPGSEVLFASALLCGPGVHVVHVTDGAPGARRRRTWTRGGARFQAAVAQARRAEALGALQRLGVDAARVHALEVPEGEAIHRAAELIDRLRAVIRALQPDVVVTHPYEGGHPDFDACAVIARAAIDRLGGTPPLLMEMASFHAGVRREVPSDFLPSAVAVHEVTVPAHQLEEKRRLMAHHAIGADWGIREASAQERLRRAPKYDFLDPPHYGPLHYELEGWMEPSAWRRAAAVALGTVTSKAAIAI